MNRFMSQFFTVMKHFNIVCGDTRFAVLMNQLSTNKNRTPLGGGQPSQTWIGLSVSGASTPLSFLLGRLVGRSVCRWVVASTPSHTHARAHARMPCPCHATHSDGLFVFRGGFVFRRRETASASVGVGRNEQGEGRKKERRATDWDGWQRFRRKE